MRRSEIAVAIRKPARACTAGKRNSSRCRKNNCSASCRRRNQYRLRRRRRRRHRHHSDSAIRHNQSRSFGSSFRNGCSLLKQSGPNLQLRDHRHGRRQGPRDCRAGRRPRRSEDAHRRSRHAARHQVPSEDDPRTPKDFRPPLVEGRPRPSAEARRPLKEARPSEAAREIAQTPHLAATRASRTSR